VGSVRRLLRRLGHELRALALAAAYFGLWFLAALTILDLLLEDYDVDPPGLSRALVFAFVTAKVVVTFDRLPLAHLPGLAEVALRSTLYTLAAFWLLVLEKTVETRAAAGGLAPAFRGVFDPTRHAGDLGAGDRLRAGLRRLHRLRRDPARDRRRAAARDLPAPPGGPRRIGPMRKGAGPPAPLPISQPAGDQRLENWKLRRALRLPYFLRSTTRLSRVRKPAALSGARRPGS
jgi:hypothetical protein